MLIFNKSFLTNLCAATATLIGYYLSFPLVFSIGLFALSGAFTNWLAIYMLFERVPGLYGSGIIPLKFESFKVGIHTLIMTEFFTEENLVKFLDENQPGHQFNFEPVIESLDLTPAFKALVSAVEESSFGSMLAMVGGSKAIEPLETPFIAKMKHALISISQTDAFHKQLHAALDQKNIQAELLEKASHIVTERLNELTPEMVKRIVQEMIRTHLGWLVIWGGVFGGLFGCIAHFLP